MLNKLLYILNCNMLFHTRFHIRYYIMRKMIHATKTFEDLIIFCFYDYIIYYFSIKKNIKTYYYNYNTTIITIILLYYYTIKHCYILNILYITIY